MKACKVCGSDVIDLEAHLLNVHNMTLETYNRIYPKIDFIDFSDTKPNIKNKVACKICSLEMKQINNTHLRTHGVTCKEYTFMYGTTRCGKTHAKIADNKPKKRFLCRICNKNVKDLVNHLIRIHKMSLKNYHDSYEAEIIKDGLVPCKECGLEVLFVSNTHLKGHNTSAKDYKLLHGKRRRGTNHKYYRMPDDHNKKLHIKGKFKGIKRSPEAKEKLRTTKLRNPHRYAKKCWETEFHKLMRILGIRCKYNRSIKGLHHPFDFKLPDICALVELDSCFYHNCPKCYPKGTKYASNGIRDKDLEVYAVSKGYQIIRIPWHDYKQHGILAFLYAIEGYLDPSFRITNDLCLKAEALHALITAKYRAKKLAAK